MTSSSRRHWKKPEVDEDEIPTTGSQRQIRLKYHNKKLQHEKLENEDDNEDDGSEVTSLRRHKTQHQHHQHHRHRDEEEDFDDKLSRRHNQYEDSVENEDEVKDEKPLTQKKHHSHHHNKNDEESDNSEKIKTEVLSGGEHSEFTNTKEDEESNEKENSKMFEVEESLGEADEKNNIARHRSFRPKAQGNTEHILSTG